jgi:hypothetical protein
MRTPPSRRHHAFPDRTERSSSFRLTFATLKVKADRPAPLLPRQGLCSAMWQEAAPEQSYAFFALLPGQFMHVALLHGPRCQ